MIDRRALTAQKHLCNVLNSFVRPGGRLSNFTPILRQPPRGGGGEDGLAEALEQGGDAGQAGVDGVYAGEDGVEFVGDAFLLGHWCQWHF